DEKPAGGAGRLADRPGPSADGPRLRQPRLAVPLRPRAGRDGQRLRRQRGQAEPPGAARPPGERVRAPRPALEAAAPPDRAKRNLRLPFGQAFDQPDLQTSCPRRETSTHALQALEMLNGRTANRLAEAFAERLRREAGSDRVRQMELAYRLTTGRAPTAAERV